MRTFQVPSDLQERLMAIMVYAGNQPVVLKLDRETQTSLVLMEADDFYVMSEVVETASSPEIYEMTTSLIGIGHQTMTLDQVFSS